MNYEERLNRMTAHLDKHPHDYQTSLSFLKMRSRYIDHERSKKKLNAWKNVQKYKEHDHGK